jgi:hypothetical protein
MKEADWLPENRSGIIKLHNLYMFSEITHIVWVGYSHVRNKRFIIIIIIITVEHVWSVALVLSVKGEICKV